MRKIIRKAAVLAMALIMALSLAAPARAEVPVSWLADLLAWYLAQNGVNITVLFPGTGEHDNFGSTPTVQIFAGDNLHYLTNAILGDGESFYGYSDYVDRHYGILFDVPGGTEGLGIEYSFTRHMFAPWFNAPTPYAYTNGLANGSDEWAGLSSGSQMIGTLAWMVPRDTLGSGNARMQIVFDFWYNGWRYGGVINNHVVGAYQDDEDWTWVFEGTYTGARTNINAPLTRSGYANR